MRVFVLTPGRTGSTTLFKAFSHSTSFSVGQQTNWGKLGPARLEYPDQHIESDARNIFFMDALADLYKPEETHWIVMHRRLEDVSESYAKRRSHFGIIHNFGVGIVGLKTFASDDDWLQAAELFVRNSYIQIEKFIHERPNVHHIDLSEPIPAFSQIWGELQAGEGLELGCKEWNSKHNPSVNMSIGGRKYFHRFMGRL